MCGKLMIQIRVTTVLKSTKSSVKMERPDSLNGSEVQSINIELIFTR